MKRYSFEKIISELEKKAEPEYVETMLSYGIPPGNILGIKNPELRKIARRIGVDHELAILLWNYDLFESKMLATYIADPRKMNILEAEKWAREIDSWPICDSICKIFSQMEASYEMAVSWSSKETEFLKRAGFVIMVNLAIHDKRATDDKLESFFPHIIRESSDDRKYVKKGVNWALRQIGKRSLYLNQQAIAVAQEIKNQGTRSAKWIASDALKELTSKAVIDRLHYKARKSVSPGQ